MFVTRFGATVELTIGAMILGLALGIPLGYMAAKRRGGSLDNGSIVVSLIGIAVPVFFLAFLLKYVFAVKLGLLPAVRPADAGHRRHPGDRACSSWTACITREWDAAWDSVKHLILPWIALGTIPFAVIFRITRASVLEVQGEDFVRTAEAKGLTNSDDPGPARAAQRHAAGDHGDRAADRAAAGRRRADREGLRLPGPR